MHKRATEILWKLHRFIRGPCMESVKHRNPVQGVARVGSSPLWLYLSTHYGSRLYVQVRRHMPDHGASCPIRKDNIIADY